MLYDWAERILIVEESIRGAVHPEYQEKVELIDIGPDIWGLPFNPELLRKIETLC